MSPSKARVGKAELKSNEPNKESLDFLIFAVHILESLLAFLGDPGLNGGFIVDFISYKGVKGDPEVS